MYCIIAFLGVESTYAVMLILLSALENHIMISSGVS